MFEDPKIRYIKLDWDSCKQLFLLIGHCCYHDPLIINVVEKIQFFERLHDFLTSILPNYCLKVLKMNFLAFLYLIFIIRFHFQSRFLKF